MWGPSVMTKLRRFAHVPEMHSQPAFLNSASAFKYKFIPGVQKEGSEKPKSSAKRKKIIFLARRNIFVKSPVTQQESQTGQYFVPPYCPTSFSPASLLSCIIPVFPASCILSALRPLYFQS